MKEPAAPGHEPLFAWERAHQFRWSLLGFIAISFGAHIASFFLFGIAYPQRATLPAPAPEVMLLLPNSPEHRSLLRRLEADDPALTATATSIVPPILAEAKYRTSYETPRTFPSVPAETATVIAPPPPISPLAFIRSGDAAPSPASVAPPPQPTRVVFSPALAARAPQQSAALTLTQRAKAPLEPATFLVGVSDRGEIRFVFPQQPSGDDPLDAEAAALLPKIDLAHGDETITWGTATVEWGDDVYAKPARNAKAAAPTSKPAEANPKRP